MQVNPLIYGVCFLLVAVGAYLVPEQGHAFGFVPTSVCGGLYEARYGGLSSTEGFTTVFVTCVEELIVNTGQNLFGEMVGMLRPFMIAAMTLAITWFGVQIMFGMVERPADPAVTLAIKIGLLFWLYNVETTLPPVVSTTAPAVTWLYTAVLDLMQSVLAAVTTTFSTAVSTIPNSTTPPQPFVMSCADDTLPVELRTWARMDCLVGKIFGFPTTIDIATIGTNTRSLTQGILLLMGAIFLTGTAGIFLFMIALSSIVALLIAMYRAVFNYILVIMMLFILFTLLPLIVPAVFFKATDRFFTAWLKQVVAYAVQPVMLFAFLPVFFMLFEMILFDNVPGNIRSIREVLIDVLQPGPPQPVSPMYGAGNNALDPRVWDMSYLLHDSVQGIIKPTTIFSINFMINPEWFNDMNVSFANPITGNQMFEIPLEGVLKGTADTVNSLFSAVEFGIKLPLADWGANHIQVLQELTISFVGMMILAYLMLKVLNHIPVMGHSLIGGQFVRATPSRGAVEARATALMTSTHGGLKRLRGK